jgi:hypothetical protein
VFPARCVDVTCQSDAESPQMVCGPGFPDVFHSLLYKSNRPSGVSCVARPPDEHHANDAGPELEPPAGGGGALGDMDVGTGDGFEVGPVDDGCGAGLGDAAGPDCAAHWTGAALAGHFGAAVTEMRVSFPDARQAYTVRPRLDVPDALAKLTTAAERLPCTAYPPTAAAAAMHNATASGASLLYFL